jgi:hypothetical protein
MPTIGVAVTAETKERFEAIARNRSITTSRLAASLILEFLLLEPTMWQGHDQALSTMVDFKSARGRTKTEQVFVRLDPYYFSELGRLASERNWYRSTYLANLFQAHADRRPILCEAEINAVRQIARQLANLGRNINQISRKLNVTNEHAHLFATVDFELVNSHLALEANAMRALLKANLRGWGISDA